MIDLGTGNNNKMCVALFIYASRSKSYISRPYSQKLGYG